MELLLKFLRENPTVTGIGLFLAVALTLAVVLGGLMRRSEVSLRPLVFFFGFLSIVAGPQAALHLLNAFLSGGTTPAVAKTDTNPRGAVEGSRDLAATSGTVLSPVPWDVVFGPAADPDLVTDAKRGLEAILGAASEARLSFQAGGESALAARFATPRDAAAAVQTYASFFQFTNASGSDTVGWTARRFGGAGEWNHVVAAGNELYAWTGATRENVVQNRVRALGPFDDPPQTAPGHSAVASGPDADSTRATTWLTRHKGLMILFASLNLLAAVLWFFKASAWSSRRDAKPGAMAVDAASLRHRLLAVNRLDIPMTVTESQETEALAVEWRHADARWIDLMRAHRLRRTHRLVLTLDEAAKKVRVREYWSAWDASAGGGDVRMSWRASMGMEFFHVQKTRVFGVQLDSDGKPTGEWSKSTHFNLQTLKQPFVEAVTSSGWTWQPVMWNAPDSLRWLTE